MLGEPHRLRRRHPLSGGPRPLELVLVERRGRGGAAAFEVRRLVRRPGVPLPLLEGGGRTQQRGRPPELPGLDGHRRNPVQAVRDRPPVAPPLPDPERLPGQLPGPGEVAELPLDHAQVRGLRADGREVAPLPGELDPPGHEVACPPKVASHLGRDSEDMQRVRASDGVVGVLDRPQRLLAQRPRPVQVLAKGDPRQPAQGQGDRGPVAQAAGELQALPVQGARLLVGALPEGEQPVLVQRDGPEGVVDGGRLQRALQPPASGPDAAGDPQEIGERGGQGQRVMRVAPGQQPVERRLELLEPALEPVTPPARVQSPQPTACVLGEGEERPWTSLLVEGGWCRRCHVRLRGRARIGRDDGDRASSRARRVVGLISAAAVPYLGGPAPYR